MVEGKYKVSFMIHCVDSDEATFTDFPGFFSMDEICELSNIVLKSLLDYLKVD